MPSRKCCCIGCPDYCLAYGMEHGPCGSFETALFYILGPAPRTEYLGTGPCIVTLPPVQIRQPSDCEWVGDSDPPTGPGGPVPTWTLEIIDEDEAEIRLDYDGGTFIYRPSELFEEEAQCQVFDRPYSPLCTHVFELDVLESDTPTCLIPRCVCVTLANGCCDSPVIRQDSPMPRTLYATVLYCFGETSNNVEEVELTWDGSIAPTGAWAGSKAIGNGTLFIEVSCICGLENGCGTTESPCYQIRARHSVCATSWETLSQSGCECDPFELTDAIFSTAQLCCAAEFTQDWVIQVTE